METETAIETALQSYRDLPLPVEVLYSCGHKLIEEWSGFWKNILAISEDGKFRAESLDGVCEDCRTRKSC